MACTLHVHSRVRLAMDPSSFVILSAISTACYSSTLSKLLRQIVIDRPMHAPADQSADTLSPAFLTALRKLQIAYPSLRGGPSGAPNVELLVGVLSCSV